MLKVNNGEGYWRLVKAQWFDRNESQGQHHILVNTLGQDGGRTADAPIQISWRDGYAIIRTEFRLVEDFAANYAMYALAPAYSAQPIDAPADRVENMGLGEIDEPQLAHHTSYGLTWRWTIAGTIITPIPEDMSTLVTFHKYQVPTSIYGCRN